MYCMQQTYMILRCRPSLNIFIMSLEVVMIEAKEEKLFTPKKKVGRLLGSKDKKPRKSPVRKVQP